MTVRIFDAYADDTIENVREAVLVESIGGVARIAWNSAYPEHEIIGALDKIEQKLLASSLP